MKTVQRGMLVLALTVTLLTMLPGAQARATGANVWTPLGPAGVIVRSFAISPNWPADRTIVLGADGTAPRKYYRTTDGGATWWSRQPNADSLSDYFNAIALSPKYRNGGADQTVLLSGCYGWVYGSDDSGANWYTATTGTTIWDYAFSPDFETDRTVFASGGNGVVRSVDGGHSYTAVNAGLPGESHWAIAVSPNYSADQTVFVCSYFGVYKSVDGGSSWVLAGLRRTTPYLGPGDMVVSPDYANDKTVYVGASGEGIYRSTDGGSSWTLAHPSAGLIGSQCMAISRDYSIDGTVLVLYTPSIRDAWTGMVVTTDGGETWTRVEMTGLPPHVLAAAYYNLDLAISPDFSTDRAIFLGTVDGIWTTTLASPNRPPVAEDKSITTAEDTPASIVLSGSDADGDPLNFAVLSNPSHGNLTGTAPNVTYVPCTDYGGADSFTYKANDGQADSSVATVSIDITPVNDVPRLSPIGNKATAEGELLSFTVSATDPDSSSLTYLASNLPAGASFNPVGQTFGWRPRYDQAGTYPGVSFSVSDGLLSTAEEIIITVNETPLPDLTVTSIVAPETGRAAEQILVSWTVRNLGNASVAGNRHACIYLSADNRFDALDIRLAELGYSSPFPARGTANLATTVTIPQVSAGPYHLLVILDFYDTILESNEENNLAARPIAVSVNQAPVLVPIGDRTADEGETLSFTVLAADPDGDPLVYSAFNLPDGASFDASTGAFGWTPGFTQAGTYPNVRFEAGDGSSTASETITVVVRDITPAELTSRLIVFVSASDLREGAKNSLVSKLANAAKSLEKGQTTAAANQLEAFINEVSGLSREHVPNGLADTLTGKARTILGQL